MKVLLSSSNPSNALVVPLIPLIKEEEKAYAKGSYTTLKLRSNPAEENSLIYEIQVPYFKSGTCEQFLDKVQAVVVGQNLTTGPQRVAFMRTLLKGDVYTYFNQYFMTVSNEDVCDIYFGSSSLDVSHFSSARFAYAETLYAALYA